MARDSLDNVREFASGIATGLWPGAVVESVEPMRGDASTRSYARLRLSGGGAPSTLVVMIMQDAAVAMSSEELGVFGKDGPRELAFVNVGRYLARLTESVPVIHGVSPDSRLLVLEDVGDTPLWDASADNPAEIFGRALDLIAELQAKATDDGGGCYAFVQSFDEKLFAWEFEHFLEYGVAGAEPALMAESRRELLAVATRLAALPRVFAHRDYHAWNIHVQYPGGGSAQAPGNGLERDQREATRPGPGPGNQRRDDRGYDRFRDRDRGQRQERGYGQHGERGRAFDERGRVFVEEPRLRLIDFQDALLAPALYDVASLLTDRITPERITPGLEESLLVRFYSRQKAGRLESLAATRVAYRLIALQRVLKVVGRFHYLAEVKGKPHYLSLLPAVCQTARRLLATSEGVSATARLFELAGRDPSREPARDPARETAREPEPKAERPKIAPQRRREPAPKAEREVAPDLEPRTEVTPAPAQKTARTRVAPKPGQKPARKAATRPTPDVVADAVAEAGETPAAPPAAAPKRSRRSSVKTDGA